MTAPPHPTPAGALPARPRIDTLILDAGALISQTPLSHLATRYLMPPSVLAELKDASARSYLSSLQLRSDFDLQLVQPSSEAVAAVSDFAKRTGDLAVLSTQDLEVLALTWMKEVERFGMWRIRREVGGKTGQQLFALGLSEEKPPASGEGKRRRRNKKSTAGAGQGGKDQDHHGQPGRGTERSEAVEAPQEEADSDDLARQMEAKASVAESSAPPASTAQPQPSGSSASDAAHIDTAPANEEEVDVVEGDSDDDDGEGEWITPDNIQYHKNVSLGLITHETKPPAPVDPNALPADGSRHDDGATQEELDAAAAQAEADAAEGWETVAKPHKESTVRRKAHAALPFGAGNAAGARSKAKQPQHLAVACMTGDFAIQNVLLQIGLALVGVGGQQISQVKSYVLRCHACMKVCKDMERKWCPSCGNATLQRVTASVDSRHVAAAGGGTQPGALRLHLKPNFEYRKRGTVYSMPLPKPGSSSGGVSSGANLILREDQVEWQRALALEKSRKRKEEKRRDRAAQQGKDSLSMRYEEAWETGDMFLYGDSAPKTGGLPRIGMGRKNPNEARRARK